MIFIHSLYQFTFVTKVSFLYKKIINILNLNPSNTELLCRVNNDK